MKISRGQILFVFGALLVNAVVWIVPSDVVELVARDRQTLLGRYSREHFAWIIALIPITAVAIFLHLSPNNAVKKKKAFGVAAVLLFLVPTVLGLDLYLRLVAEYPYVLGDLAYRRPADADFEGVFEDKPEAIRTYPNAAPGFPDVPWTLSADGRGFRNAETLQSCDVLTVGDSFTEGDHVSDQHAWPVRFAEKSGLSVYNVGMPGYAPQHYLAALKDPGLKLKPRLVLCTIYEGNDFRSAKRITEATSEWKRYFKRSPIVQAIDKILIDALGPIGARRDLAELGIVSWLPIAYPPEVDTKHYAFPPSFLVRHYMTGDEFAASKYWKNTRHNLEQMRELCLQAGAELIVVYAPTKPHVVLPLVRDELPADKVRAFTALRAKRDLPEPAEFMQTLFRHLDAKESLVRKWCDDNQVAMISLTEPLRDSVRQGQQAFYTYNEHWSPIGHAVAADAVHRFWAARPASVVAGQ